MYTCVYTRVCIRAFRRDFYRLSVLFARGTRRIKLQVEFYPEFDRELQIAKSECKTVISKTLTLFERLTRLHERLSSVSPILTSAVLRCYEPTSCDDPRRSNSPPQHFPSTFALRDAIIVTRDATAPDMFAKMFRHFREIDTLRPGISSLTLRRFSFSSKVRLRPTSPRSFHSHLDTTRGAKIRMENENTRLETNAITFVRGIYLRVLIWRDDTPKDCFTHLRRKSLLTVVPDSWVTTLTSSDYDARSFENTVITVGFIKWICVLHYPIMTTLSGHSIANTFINDVKKWIPRRSQICRRHHPRMDVKEKSERSTTSILFTLCALSVKFSPHLSFPPSFLSNFGHVLASSRLQTCNEIRCG